MEMIKVKKTDLLTTLKKNLDKHREIFLEAQAGYRKMAITEIEKLLEDARKGHKIRRSISLIEPVDQSRDYVRVIRMLEMSVDKTIELAEHDFMQYVMDDWSWKHQFITSNAMYSHTAALSAKE